jgi:hypothetical protein
MHKVIHLHERDTKMTDNEYLHYEAMLKSGITYDDADYFRWLQARPQAQDAKPVAKGDTHDARMRHLARCLNADDWAEFQHVLCSPVDDFQADEYSEYGEPEPHGEAKAMDLYDLEPRGGKLPARGGKLAPRGETKAMDAAAAKSFEDLYGEPPRRLRCARIRHDGGAGGFFH